MDTRTNEIFSTRNELDTSVADQLRKLLDRDPTDEEVLAEIKSREESGRIIHGSMEELKAIQKRRKLANGTKNQRKKYRKLQKASRKKNRSK